MSVIKLGRGLALPAQAATSTFGILAKRGAGKSNAAVVMAEEMFDAGIPWVAVDPKGDWWGLRASGDGKGPGLPIVVFGGRHGDIPLEPTAGAMIADLVLDKLLTCVLDVSEFSNAETNRFLLTFAERLYRQAHDDVIHLFLEEAHEYLPQRVMHDQAKVVGAFQKIVKQGRFKGLGCTLISQRSASLNKDVLTQIDTLIVLRTTSPQDRAAVKAWIDVHEDAPNVMSELPSLKSGEAWFWSPEDLGILQKVQFRKRRTFDSGATPEVGKTRQAPSTLADVDLAAIKEAMAETIERAKADDPKELRKEIISLRKQLDDTIAAVGQITEVEVAVNVVPEAMKERAYKLAEQAEAMARQVKIMGDDVQDFANEVSRWSIDVDGLPEPLPGVEWKLHSNVVEPGRIAPPNRQPMPRTIEELAEDVGRELGVTVERHESWSRPTRPTPPRSDKKPSAEHRILMVLAAHGPRTPQQLCLQAGISPKSSTLSVALSKLRKEGLVESGQPIQITESGFQKVDGQYAPLPSGPALLEYWRGELGEAGAERRVFDVLAGSYGISMSREYLCDLANISPGSSTLSVAMSKLRKLGLVAKNAYRLDDEFARLIGLA